MCSPYFIYMAINDMKKIFGRVCFVLFFDVFLPRQSSLKVLVTHLNFVQIGCINRTQQNDLQHLAFILPEFV